MMTSYYINEIEKKLKLLSISLDNESYNNIFTITDDKVFLKKLRLYNEYLNKKIDSLEMDGMD